MPVTHESILKLISYRFGLGHLNKRHRYASNIGRSFDFKRKNIEPPELPIPSSSRPHPAAAQGGANGGHPRPKPHDLDELETIGLARGARLRGEPATSTRSSASRTRSASALEGATRPRQ